MWLATGRIVDVPMWPITEAERVGATGGGGWIDAVFTGDPDALQGPTIRKDLPTYLARAVHGSFPELAYAHLPERERGEWLRAYLRQIISRDTGGRNSDRLGRYFNALAACTASTPSDVTLSQAAGVSRITAALYEQLFEDLFILRRLPAWSSNRLSRLAKASKVHLVDPALVTASLGMNLDSLLSDGELLGRVLETFAVAHSPPRGHRRPTSQAIPPTRTRRAARDRSAHRAGPSDHRG